MHLPSPFDQLPNTAHRRIELAARNTLFHQGEPTRGVFYLIKGNLQLRRVTENGDEIVLHKASAGSTFAEASLFAPAFHCDAFALDECSIVEIEKKRRSEAVRYRHGLRHGVDGAVCRPGSVLSATI